MNNFNMLEQWSTILQYKIISRFYQLKQLDILKLKKRDWKIDIAIKRMINLWEKWQESKHYS